MDRAVLDGHNRVQYRAIDLGRDFGVEIWVLNGLQENERVVVHPGDDLPEGTVVDPVPMPSLTGSGTAQFKQQ